MLPGGNPNQFNPAGICLRTGSAAFARRWHHPARGLRKRGRVCSHARAPTPLCPVRPRKVISRGSWCPKPPSSPPRFAGGAGLQGSRRSGVREPSACIPQHGCRQAGAAAPRSAETTRSRCWSGKDLVVCKKSAPCLHQPLLGGGDAPRSSLKPFLLQAQPLLPSPALAAFPEPPPKACRVWGPQTRSNILGTT